MTEPENDQHEHPTHRAETAWHHTTEAWKGYLARARAALHHGGDTDE